MELTDRVIAVTGATGFLGSYIALELQARGARVRAVIRNLAKGSWLEDRGIQLHKADLADRAALQNAFEGADAIVSNAGLFRLNGPSWDEYYQANKVGTDNVYEAAVGAGVDRIVQISTCGIYGPIPMQDRPETARRLTLRDRRWAGDYYVSKALSEERAEELAAEHGLKLTVLRPGAIYGERDHATIPTFQKLMRLPVLVAPSFKLQFVHAGDVAIAVAGALENDASIGQTYNVAGETRSIHRFMRDWRKVSGRRRPLLLPVWLPMGATYDIRAAKRDLGFTNRPIPEGLRGAI